jgi:hypothetical protein
LDADEAELCVVEEEEDNLQAGEWHKLTKLPMSKNEVQNYIVK